MLERLWTSLFYWKYPLLKNERWMWLHTCYSVAPRGLYDFGVFEFKGVARHAVSGLLVPAVCIKSPCVSIPLAYPISILVYK